MTPKKQRVAIAQSVGWEWKRQPEESTMNAWYNGEKYAWDFKGLHDYLNDLNAMHEVEKSLNEKQSLRYLVNLVTVVGQTREGTIGGNINMAVFATATQRAEAYLKTLGLWKP